MLPASPCLACLSARPAWKPPASPPSPASIVRTILHKDVVTFRRNKFLMLITFLVIVVWGVLYQFLPTTVDETFSVGLVVEQGALPPEVDLSPEALETADGTGVQVTVYPDLTSLEVAVDEGSDVQAGLLIPAGFAAEVAAGATPTVTLVVPAGLPAQFEGMLQSAVAELGYALSGTPSPIDLATSTTIVGTDRVGDQLSLADQMRPLLLIVVLMMEIFALATLVAGEIAERTAVAILATPAKASELITAKMIFGTVMAFAEAVLVGILIRAFGTNPLMILTALLLGAVVVTGLGLLAGSFGRDFMDTLILGILFMIPLMIPAMAALFPGAGPDWVQVLPTYGVVHVVVGASAGTLSWADAAVPLLSLAAWGVALAALGAMTLNRRVARL
jgi:ABC-2 type transport system permease protein